MPFWYSNSKLAWLLLPFSLLFWLISQIRRALFSLISYPLINLRNRSLLLVIFLLVEMVKPLVVVWLVEELQKQDYA